MNPFLWICWVLAISSLFLWQLGVLVYLLVYTWLDSRESYICKQHDSISIRELNSILLF